MQVGKWRRQVTIPTVTSCVDNPITDANLTRLPRTQSEGHMPKIALTTGGSDAIECFLREIGIADSEFTTDAGTGRVNLYVGGDGHGERAGDADQLLGRARWRDLPGRADALVEHQQAARLRHPHALLRGGAVPRRQEALHRQHQEATPIRAGASSIRHLHFYWLRNGPTPWPTTAVYLGAQNDFPKPPMSVTATIDTTFPKGAAFGQWMTSTGATTTPGSIALYGSQHSVAVDHAADLAAVALHPGRHGLRRAQRRSST